MPQFLGANSSACLSVITFRAKNNKICANWSGSIANRNATSKRHVRASHSYSCKFIFSARVLRRGLLNILVKMPACSCRFKEIAITSLNSEAVIFIVHNLFQRGSPYSGSIYPGILRCAKCPFIQRPWQWSPPLFPNLDDDGCV